MQQSVEAIDMDMDMDMVRVGIKEDWFGGINGATMDSTGAGIIRAGLDVIVTVIVCGVLFIVLPLVPKGQTPSARNKQKKALARRRQSEHKFGSHE